MHINGAYERRIGKAEIDRPIAQLVLDLEQRADVGELLRAMTFMIVASPCAVVLATMPPLLAAMANAGRHGVLVKSAVVMEQLGATTRVAFDKTGTLTEGTPRVALVGAQARPMVEWALSHPAGVVQSPPFSPLPVFKEFWIPSERQF